MPRTRSLAWSELKIGVLTIVSIAIAGVLIFALTGTRGFAWQRYMLKTRLSNVAGLAKGSPVRVAGVEVGSVKAVEFAGEQVDIVFDMRKDMRDRITTGSVAKLSGAARISTRPSATPQGRRPPAARRNPPLRCARAQPSLAVGVARSTPLVATRSFRAPHALRWRAGNGALAPSRDSGWSPSAGRVESTEAAAAAPRGRSRS